MTGAEKLKKFRFEKNWTQREMAEYLGVTRVSIVLWEDGSIPTPSNRVKIEEKTGIKAKYFERKTNV